MTDKKLSPLEIPELLLNIFSSRDVNSGNAKPVLTLQLNRVALVCKVFRDPALEVLWGSQTIDLRTLFCCFPSDVVVVATGKPLTLSIPPGRSLSPQEWERLRFYAGCIKSLTVPNSDVIAVGCEFMTAALNPNFIPDANPIPEANSDHNPKSIFAKLRRLKWDNTNSSTSPWLIHLLHAGITDLEVKFSHHLLMDVFGGHSANQPHADQIPRYTNLRSLEIWGSSSSDVTLPSTFHNSLPKLQSFTCQPELDLQGLAELSHLPTLQSIEIALFPSTQCDFLAEIRNLRHATVSVDSLGRAGDFLKVIHSSPINHLSIEFEAYNPKSSIAKTLFTGLHIRTPGLLTFLQIGHISAEHWDYSNSALGLRMIEPLLDCGNLKTLKFNVHLSMKRVNDRLLLRMTTAWPNLEHLSLGLKGVSSSSKVTVEGLRALQNCPSLEVAELPFNTESNMSYDTLPPQRAACSLKLKKLYAFQSTIPNPRSLAAALLDMFPNLEEIAGSEPEDPDMEYDDDDSIELHDSWAECQETYKWFKAYQNRGRGIHI
ncbi:hypothetical protein HWV62_41316 [Athelia sp. TMB]|nr:hypothetical protein HWV62_41316 [Athelia sp. TMB]